MLVTLLILLLQKMLLPLLKKPLLQVLAAITVSNAADLAAAADIQYIVLVLAVVEEVPLLQVLLLFHCY